MINSVKSQFFLVLFFISIQAKALNFHELYVKGYETADPHETEFENTTSLTSDMLFFTSLEINHGFTDSLELAAYIDLERGEYTEFKTSAFRAHAKKSLFKRGQFWLDSALELELELPKESDENYAIDTKFIFQKNVEKWSFVLAPAIEYVSLKEKNSEGKDSEFEKHISTQILYKYSAKLNPKIEYFSELNDEPENVFLIGYNYELKHGLEYRVSFGSTNAKENILSAGFEIELFE